MCVCVCVGGGVDGRLCVCVCLCVRSLLYVGFFKQTNVLLFLLSHTISLKNLVLNSRPARLTHYYYYYYVVVVGGVVHGHVGFNNMILDLVKVTL